MSIFLWSDAFNTVGIEFLNEHCYVHWELQSNTTFVYI